MKGYYIFALSRAFDHLTQDTEITVASDYFARCMTELQAIQRHDSNPDDWRGAGFTVYLPDAVLTVKCANDEALKIDRLVKRLEQELNYNE